MEVIVLLIMAGGIVAGGVGFILIGRLDRRRPAGFCQHCGYDRSGLPTDGLCPECGHRSDRGLEPASTRAILNYVLCPSGAALMFSIYAMTVMFSMHLAVISVPILLMAYLAIAVLLFIFSRGLPLVPVLLMSVFTNIGAVLFMALGVIDVVAHNHGPDPFEILVAPFVPFGASIAVAIGAGYGLLLSGLVLHLVQHRARPLFPAHRSDRA